jgi:hemolysin III
MPDLRPRTRVHGLLIGPGRAQSQGEGPAKSISYGIALVAMLVGTPVLIIGAVQRGEVGLVVGTSIFSATAVLLFFSSTLYHALPLGKAKRVFRVIEHSAIFLLIANLRGQIPLLL